MAYNITKPEIWFFKSVEERNSSGIPRLRILDGQYIPTGDGKFEKCNTDYNVQSATGPRSENPVGTIFAAKSITKKKTPSGTEHYSADQGSGIISMTRGVSPDIAEAYKEYQAQAGTPSPDLEEEPLPAAAAGPKGKSTIEILMDKYPVPTVAKDNFYVKPELWKSLLFNLHQGYNTMLVGESGTGKTELTMKIAALMGKAIDIFDMGAKQDPIASLVGVHRFEGKSIFDRASFTHAIERDGIIVLDEISRAPMNTNNILFPVLDSRRELTMDIASSKLRSIKVNPGCRFIATANEGYRYTGTNVIDQALKERFQILVIDYMPNDIEVDLLMKRTGVSKTDAKVIVKTSSTIRSLAAKDELNNSVSVRHSLYAADMVAGGFNLVTAMESAFLPMYVAEEERKKVKDLLAAR